MLNYRFFQILALIFPIFVPQAFHSDLMAFGPFLDSAQNLGNSIFCGVGIDSCVADIDEDGDVDGKELTIMAAEFLTPDCRNQLITKVMNENVTLK